MNMDIVIEQKKILTVFSPKMLEGAVQKDFNLIAAGTPRGGTSILGILMKIFNFEMGQNVHPETYEDLDLHMTDIANWGQLISQKVKETPNWSIKYPAATWHLKLFNEFCPNPVFLIIIRNPFTVAKSMIKHDSDYSNIASDYYKGMKIALDSYSNLNFDMQEINAPFVFVEHEKIMNNPKLFIKEFVETFNIHTDEETIQKAISLISTPGYKRIDAL